MKTYRLFIDGTVQGVLFRKFVQDMADELSLKGYCRNLDNGKIEVVIEGHDDNINKMIELCKKGPKHSQVRNVEANEIKHQGFDAFKILRM